MDKKLHVIAVGAPATVVIVPTLAFAAMLEVPILAVTVVASGAWLLGWKVVVAVPVESVVAVDGVKLYVVVAPYPGAVNTIGTPACTGEIIAVSVRAAEPAT